MGLTPLPEGFDVENLFIGTWASTNNKLNTDFGLYSSMSYALAGILSWNFCNYDDRDIGFPRDCGPSRAVSHQWTSLTRGGKPDYAYYVGMEILEVIFCFERKEFNIFIPLHFVAHVRRNSRSSCQDHYLRGNVPL